MTDLWLNKAQVPAVSGIAAGLASGIVVCPLDVIKTRMQIRGTYNSSKLGILQTLKTIVKEQHIRGLYSGLTPLLVGYLPSWGVYFYFYEKLRLRWGYTLSAFTAGACSTLATNPIWMVKTRLMAQNSKSSFYYKGVLDAIRTIYKQEGISAFYKGLGPALLGLPHIAIHFPVYERLKLQFSEIYNWNRSLSILLASVLSKILASTATYPHEVVRSRNQLRGTKYRGVLPTVRVLYREEGWRVFYAGMGANIVRAIPSSAVTLYTFEFVSSLLHGYLDEKADRLRVSVDELDN